MITAIFNAIVAIPAILNAITTLISWISEQVDQAQKRKASQDFKKATEDAMKNKDTSKMDELFDPGKKK